MKVTVAGLVAAASLVIGAGPAVAGDGLDIQEMLRQPGVKLVVVGFYATSCKPCVAAVPKWASLRKKYEQDGLRIIMVAGQDDKAGCVSPDWTPDQTICDDEGAIVDQLGATGLPAAYLWSWQGHLLARAADVDQAESKIEAWMRRAPRVDVEIDSMVPSSGISRKSLLTSVRSELQANGKFVVVAAAREQKYLRAIRHPSLAASADEAYACEVGTAVSANSLVKVSIGGKRGRSQLHLRLLSAEKGCLVASGSSTWDAESPGRSLSEASTKLLANLQLPRPQWPLEGTQPAASAEVSPDNSLVQAAVAPAKGDCVTDPNLRPGTITITTQPFSTIYWNGRRLGQTPLANVTMPAGCVTLVAKNEKLGLGRQVKVKVTPNSINIYRFALE